MENFDIPVKNKREEEKVELFVSGVCHNPQGETYAFVQFTKGKKVAEGKIPACEIVKNEGFSEEEKKQFEEYMRENLATLKRKASGINAFTALMGKRI